MVTTPKLRSILDDRPALGSFCGIPHPTAVEILAWSGLDFVCVDTEHAAVGPAQVEELVRAADACGVPTLVRVGSSGSEIGRALDAGAAGIICPRVESAEEALNCALAAHFPPLGRRGAGPSRAARHGARFTSYVREANDDVICALQIETKAGVDAVEEIAGVPGVDVLFVGPGDLAVSLGVAVGAPEHEAAVAAINSSAQKHGITRGTFCSTPDDAIRFARTGIRLLILGSDRGHLAAAYAAAVTAARRPGGL